MLIARIQEERKKKAIRLVVCSARGRAGPSRLERGPIPSVPGKSTNGCRYSVLRNDDL